MRIDGFRPAGEFKSHMDNWITRFREAKPVKEGQSVLIPGDPERLMESERKNQGIPLLDPVVEDLKQLGERFNVKLGE